MPLVDKWTTMWYWLACFMNARCGPVCVAFGYVSVVFKSPHIHFYFHPISNRLLKEDVFKFLDTTVNLQSKLWLYL